MPISSMMRLVAAYDNATFDEYTSSFDLSRWIALLPLRVLSQVCWEFFNIIYSDDSLGPVFFLHIQACFMMYLP